MCLILLAWQQDAALPLVVAANRDEFHRRPTQSLHWWADHPDVLAGRDLEAGGTWLGVTRNGRFAALTNFRDADRSRGRRSRGELVSDFLTGSQPPLAYTKAIDGDAYAGFNLLVGLLVGDGQSTAREMAYVNNRGREPDLLPPGIYGLANAELDAPWHKTGYGKAALTDLIAAGRVSPGALGRLLENRERARAAEVETGGLSFDLAHALTAPFIVTPDYGTRSSTVVVLDDGGGLTVAEQSYAPDGRPRGKERVEFQTA